MHSLAILAAPILAGLFGFGQLGGEVARRVDELKDPDAEIRITAARALGDFGKIAEPAIPALTTALRDNEPIVRTETKRQHLDRRI